MSEKKLKMLWILVLGATLLATSCHSPNADPPAPAAAESAQSTPVRPLPFARTQTRQAPLLDDSPLPVAAISESSTPDIQRSLEMPARSSSRAGDEITASEYPDNLIRGITDPETELEVGFIFNGDSIDVVAKTFAAENMLNFNYLVDPAVKGAVTMEVKARMTAREAWATFEHILWLSGAYASKNPGFIHILPFDKMPKEQRIFADHDIQPNVIVDFCTIRYKKSGEIANQLKPFMTDGATLTDQADSNTLIIVETPANINKIRELIKRLDNKGEREWPAKCFPCHEVDATEIATELQTLLPVLGLPVATGTGTSGGAIKISPLPRIGTIVVSAALNEVVDEVGSWIKALDRSDMLDKEEIYFYNVKHSTVEKLASSLDAFFNTVTSSSPTTSSRSISARATATTGSAATPDTASTRNRTATAQTANRTTPATAANRTPANRAQQPGQNENPSLTTTVFDTSVIVFTDDESNRLTLKTTPRTWNVVRLFLERQDVPPRQVSIQAIITDITLTKRNEFGISYAISQLLRHGNSNVSGAFAGAGPLGAMFKDIDQAALIKTLQSWNSDSGLGLIFSRGADPLAVVTAFAGEGNTRILSEPQVIVRSGAQAYLQAGTSIAIPTESTTYSNDADNFRTNYEYQDTGIIMTVTPYITAGHDVRLEIEQEVSEAMEQASPSIPPTINKKKVTSELVVADNSTILMGGMIRSRDGESYSGIPYLMDIPYLGVMFRSNFKSRERSELLILLTVNVIDSRNPQEELVRRYKASLEEIENKRETSLY